MFVYFLGANQPSSSATNWPLLPDNLSLLLAFLAYFFPPFLYKRNVCKHTVNVFEQSHEGVSCGRLEFLPPQEQMYWEQWCDSGYTVTPMCWFGSRVTRFCEIPTCWPRLFQRPSRPRCPRNADIFRIQVELLRSRKKSLLLVLFLFFFSEVGTEGRGGWLQYT